VYLRNIIMNNKGFTFIEIIMVIVVLGIIMPGVMLYFIQGVSDSAAAQRRTTAIFLAEGLMEEIKSKSWDETAGINSTCSNASAIGPDPAENRSSYDDVDDFNGIDNTPPRDSQGAAMANYPGFRQQAEVYYVDAANLNADAGSTRCYKRIAVTITDTSGGGAITLVGLKTAYSSH